MCVWGGGGSGIHFSLKISQLFISLKFWGAQWLSGSVLDSRPRVCRFESHRRHCIVVLE